MKYCVPQRNGRVGERNRFGRHGKEINLNFISDELLSSVSLQHMNEFCSESVFVSPTH